MTISVDLPPDLEARFVAEAKAKGVSVGEIVKTYLYSTPPMQSSRPLSVDELDKSLDARLRISSLKAFRPFLTMR